MPGELRAIVDISYVVFCLWKVNVEVLGMIIVPEEYFLYTERKCSGSTAIGTAPPEEK